MQHIYWITSLKLASSSSKLGWTLHTVLVLDLRKAGTICSKWIKCNVMQSSSASNNAVIQLVCALGRLLVQSWHVAYCCPLELNTFHLGLCFWSTPKTGHTNVTNSKNVASCMTKKLAQRIHDMTEMSYKRAFIELWFVSFSKTWKKYLLEPTLNNCCCWCYIILVISGQ